MFCAFRCFFRGFHAGKRYHEGRKKQGNLAAASRWVPCLTRRSIRRFGADDPGGVATPEAIAYVMTRKSMVYTPLYTAWGRNPAASAYSGLVILWQTGLPKQRHHGCDPYMLVFTRRGRQRPSCMQTKLPCRCCGSRSGMRPACCRCSF